MPTLVTSSTPTVQCNAQCIISALGVIDVIPEKYDRTRFDLRFKGVWVGSVVYLRDRQVWGCTSAEIRSHERLAVVAENCLENYIREASVSCPNFRAKLIAA